MTRTLAHRGPDDEGLYEKGAIHLGHRRLAIIDLEGSRQPMCSADGNLVLTYNGEIYNFRELREELIKQGCQFTTQGDSEVLLHAWHAYGVRMLEKLEGMFAFALWDNRQQSLFLARDHLGVKPLHYAWDGQTLVFASEIKALRKHPVVKRDIDLLAIGLYLECQFIPAPHTVYAAIHKLPPATALLLQNRQLRQWRYWHPDYGHKLCLTEDEAVHRLEEELSQSVKSMLVSDVPLGAFVSGGVDSSLIAALMSRQMSRTMDTFHLGFVGHDVHSEHREAEKVARHIGSRHHTLMIAQEDVLDIFEHWLAGLDEPFGDQAILPTLLLSRLTRQSVSVVLTGEGADEIFGGYSNYWKRNRDERFTGLLGRSWLPWSKLAHALPRSLRKDRFVRALAEPLNRRYRTIPNVFDASTHQSYFSDAFCALLSADLGDYAARFFDECNAAHYLDRIMYVDSQLWLPDDLLTKVDQATMCYALEARVPYLHPRFFEFCAGLDPHLKVRGRTGKWLLKKLAEKYLPRDITHRAKQGFFMPLSSWLAGRLTGLLEQSLADGALGGRGLFRPGVLSSLLLEQRTGRSNHAGRLWALMILESWFAHHEPDFRLASVPSIAGTYA